MRAWRAVTCRPAPPRRPTPRPAGSRSVRRSHGGWDTDALPAGVPTVKPGTKLEFSVIDSRKGPQAMSVHIIDAPVSLAENSRVNNDDLAAMIEDTIKILDRVGNGLRQGRHPSGPEAERLGRVLRGIASQLEA